MSAPDVFGASDAPNASDAAASGAADVSGAELLARAMVRLAATVDARRGADPATSYTAKLLAGGAPLAAKKFGEEAVETVIAAVQGDAHAIAAESADMLYHWLVLTAAAGVDLAAVAEKLDARAGVSGLAEKASRGG